MALASSSSGSSTSAPLTAQAQQLKSLAQRLDFFLHQQARRLESALAQAGDVSHDPKTLKQMIAEFESVRDRWEQQRQQELERIQHDSARLAEAWLKLESEQRRLLAERQALQVSGGGFALPASVVAACNGDAAPTSPSLSTQQSRASECRGEQEPAGSAELSMLEFQQLKREVRRHGRTQR